MPLLSNREACDVTDAFLLTLYGNKTFSRWNELKCRMQFDTERDYVNWVLDVVEHYELDGNPQLTGTAMREYYSKETQEFAETAAGEEEGNDGVKTEYVESEHYFQQSAEEASRKSVKYEDREAIEVESAGGMAWTGGNGNNIKSSDLEPYTVSFRDSKLRSTSRRSMRHSRLSGTGNRQGNDLFDPTNAAATNDRTIEYDGVTILSDYSDTDHDTTAADNPSKRYGKESDGSLLADRYTLSQDHDGGSQMVHPVTDDSTRDSEKRRVCPYCSYSARDTNKLKRHVTSVHERNKVHACPHCSFSSTREDTVRRHLIVKHHYSTKYSCSQCHKPFPTPSSLGKHEKRCYKHI